MEKDEKYMVEEDQMTVEDVVSMYDSYRAGKKKALSRMRQIKSFFNGDFWESFKDKVKPYTINPDTNYVEYTVSAYVNSIYSAVYIPEVIATDLEQEEAASMLNSFLEMQFLKRGIKEEFITFGTNVTLYNMQPIRHFLNEDGEPDFEEIDPFGIFLDPSVTDYEKGEAIFIVKETNIYSLLRDKRFKKNIKKYIDDHKDGLFQATEIGMQEPDYERFTTTGNKTVSVIEAFIRTEKGIDNIFVINREKIFYRKENIVPNYFPIDILYQRKPTSDPYGIPMIYKILKSYIALNILDSIDATQPYLAQNRPRFFDVRSRIDARAYKDYGNSPNAYFPLMGEPSKAVHYQDIQFIGDTTYIKERIERGIFNITGVDPAYKGRQTNSITTTGGVEAQQARVIMLTDNQPLVCLERFVEKLAKKYIMMHVEYVDKVQVPRNNFVKEQVDLIFNEINVKDFNFVLESMPYMPLTKRTRFETIKQLYEMQGQYNFQIKLIQEEDIIEELPISAIKKSKILQRISGEKQSNAALKRRENIMTFVALFSEFKNAGLTDDEATDESLRTMDEEDMMQQKDPTLGKNPTAMPPQGGTPSMF